MRKWADKWQFIVLVSITILILSGCENPFQEEEDDDTGTPPVIDDAGFVLDGDNTYEKKISLDVGSTYRLAVLLTDPELDATTVRIEEDGTTTDLTLSSQNQAQMLYLTNAIEPDSSDVGQYIAYLTPIDAAGNVGARFTLTYDVQN